MPITYKIDPEHRRVTAKAHGRLTETEILDYQNEAWSRPEVAGFDELIDMTDVVEIVSPSPDSFLHVAMHAATMDDKNSNSRFAIVASGDLHFGLGRMYSAYRNLSTSGTKQVSVFRSLAEAECWLPGQS